MDEVVAKINRTETAPLAVLLNTRRAVELLGYNSEDPFVMELERNIQLA